MPIMLTRINATGRRDLLIVLGPDSIARIKEKDPFELKWWELPGNELPGTIGVSYASDAELTQLGQLARQGKVDEAIDLATSGWKYRPEKGDHDLGPERFK